MFRYTISAAFILILLFSCSNERRSNDKVLAKMYVDLMIAEESAVSGADSLRKSLDRIYDSYSMTKDEYAEGISELKEDYERWSLFFEYAQAYLDSLKSRISD